ncbi:MAG: molybdopterin molybdotransferase MoeA [Acidobacteria bacterium]|nr:molybdopterin molybdotransferase MoeA [Acidobacteriota bacterium]
MISVGDALKALLDCAGPLPVRREPLGEALGLAAAEDLLSGERVPPFDNSAMDGYALQAGTGLRRLEVAGDLAAGDVWPELPPGKALRIMTGAPIPAGADAVVPLEETRSGPGWVELLRVPAPGAHIRRAGEDVAPGTCLVAKGQALRPADLGVLASVGLAELPVRAPARVAVLTTGNELVPFTETPGPGRIRDANLPALCAQARALGAVPLPFPRVADDPRAVEAALREALEAADLVLTTGGVSVGDRDFVKPVLERIGAEQVFWKVAQKPGQPLGLWTWRGKPVVGLPGNPVPALLMVEAYVRPALRQMMGFRHLFRPEAEAFLTDGFHKGRPDGKLHWLRVVAEQEGSRWRARLTGPQGSGILSSMMRANALALVPEGVEEVPAGGPVRLQFTELAEDH